MSKPRKAYLEAADTAILMVLQAYVEEHGERPPNGYSTLKAALTRAYNKRIADLHSDTMKRLGLKWYNGIDCTPEYKACQAEIIKEMK